MAQVGSVEFRANLDLKSLQQQAEQAKKQLAEIKDPQIKVGADASKAREEIGKLGKGATVKVPLDVATDLAKQKLGDLANFAKKTLGDVATGFGQGLGINLANNLQGAVAGAVGGVVGTVKGGLDTFIQFQDKLTTFGAVANATKEETKALADEAKRLGIETSKSPVQVGEAAVQLAKLGFSAKDTKEQVEGVVRLSEASGLQDLGKAAEVAGAAFNVFGTNTKKTADIVAAASNATAADAQDLLQAISSAGGVAKANNQSFETLAATFGLLRSAGFQAEAAGTGVKTLISNLAAPSSAEAKQGLEQLGVSVFDTSGKMRNLKDLLPEFRKALSGLTEQRQAGLTKAIFGDSGAPAFLALLSTAQSKIDDTFNTINGAEANNAAGEAAKKLLTGLPGQLKLLEGSVATLKLNLGEAIAPAFEGLAKLGTDTANEILKTSGILDGLKHSAEGFKATLADDPELAKELAAALGEAGKVLAGEVAGGAQTLTDYLKENPKAIADLVSGTADFVKLLGDAVGFAGKVVDKLGEGAQRLKGLLNPDAGDQEGTAKAVKGSGGTKADIDAVEKRTQAQVQRESLTTKIGGVDVSFGAISQERVEAIRAEEAQKQLDEVRKRNLAKTSDKALVAAAAEADAGKVSSAKGAPDLAKKDAGTDASEKTKSGQLKGVEDFNRDLTLKENKLSESAAQEITLAKKSQLTRTKTAQETEAAIAQIQARESQGKVKAIEASIAQINAAEKTGQIGAKEAETKRSELQKKLAAASKGDLENQIKARDASNRVTLEGVELRRKAEEAALTRRTAAAKLGAAPGQVETSQIDETQTQQTIALKQRELAETRKLKQQGVLSAKEAAEKELAIVAALDQEKLKLRTQQQQRELADVEQRNKLATAAIDRSVAAQTLAAKQQQLSGGGLVGEGGQTEIQRIQEVATQQTIAQKQKELAQVNDLERRKVKGAREAENERLAILQAIDGERAKLLEAQTQRELKGIQVGVDAQKRAADTVVRQLDRQKAAQDSFGKALERQAQLLSARSGLNQAVANERESTLKNAIARAGETIDAIKKLQSGEAGSNTQRVLQQQLGTSVVGDNQLLNAIKDKQALEREADEEKAAAIVRQQELERQSNELKIKQGELAAKNNLREAERAELLARQNENEAKGNVLKALKTGDKNDIENAKAGLELAKQGVELAGFGVQDARAGVSSQKEEAQIERETLQSKQRTEVNDFNASAAANQRKRDLDLAGVGDELGVNVSTGSKAPQIASLAAAVPAINIPQQSMPAPSSTQASGLEQTTSDLRALMQQILSAPRQLVVNGVENPRQDAASIWADFSRKQVGAAGQ